MRLHMGTNSSEKPAANSAISQPTQRHVADSRCRDTDCREKLKSHNAFKFYCRKSEVNHKALNCFIYSSYYKVREIYFVVQLVLVLTVLGV
jgi:hypothetical protein